MATWSEARDQICAALVAYSADISNPPKNAVNPHFKSRYTSLDCALDHVRPVLAKHGLALLQSAEAGSDGIAIVTTIVHASGQWRESVSVYAPDKSGVQAAGSAITYGRRYDLLAACGIAGDPDDDGESATDHDRPPPSARERDLRAVTPPREQRPEPRRQPAPSNAQGHKLPNVPKVCGESAGKPIADAATRHLVRFVEWQEKVNYGDEKYRDRNMQLCDAIREELRAREDEAASAGLSQSGGGAADDDIPFMRRDW